MPAEGVSRPEPSPFYIKPTYFALSKAINDAIESIGNLTGNGFPHEKAEVTDAFEKLKDQLFLSPRLEQWKAIKGGIGSEYRIYNSQQDVFVSVYRDKIAMEKAGDEYVVVGDPLLAETLFNNLESAQALIQQRIKEDETDPESFFGGAEPDFYEGAGLDAALEESHSDALVEEDAELIEEVLGTDEPNEFGESAWKDSTPGQIAVEDEDDKVGERVLGDVDLEPKKHSPKHNKSASSEAQQVKEEYKDKEDNPVKDYPKTANTQVVSRLKSLQGRLLNIVEASFTDKDQRAAVKTLVNKEFRREMNNFNKGSWNGFSAADED